MNPIWDYLWVTDIHTERSQVHTCLYISLTEFAVIPTIINSYYYYYCCYYYCNLRRVTCNLHLQPATCTCYLQPATCKLHPPCSHWFQGWSISTFLTWYTVGTSSSEYVLEQAANNQIKNIRSKITLLCQALFYAPTLHPRSGSDPSSARILLVDDL